jgi:4,5-DOPA dioxygenase extradiol
MTFTPPLFPAVFAGHGSPMNAIEDNAFSQGWADLGRELPRPQAILCISAHWQSHGTRVTAMARPRTIYDFYGFPPELYQQNYPAPGSLELAARVRRLLSPVPVELDQEWGLDHGAWSVLLRMYPQADIPVVQLSLDEKLKEKEHFALARSLRALRQEGVLVLGSGNIVHNLGMILWEGGEHAWAHAADERVAAWISAGDHSAIVNYPGSSLEARLAIPTNEHFLPLLYILAQQEHDEPVRFFNAETSMGSLSMRGVVVG